LRIFRWTVWMMSGNLCAPGMTSTSAFCYSQTRSSLAAQGEMNRIMTSP
jgi:hypothetical protein